MKIKVENVSLLLTGLGKNEDIDLSFYPSDGQFSLSIFCSGTFVSRMVGVRVFLPNSNVWVEYNVLTKMIKITNTLGNTFEITHRTAYMGNGDIDHSWWELHERATVYSPRIIGKDTIER